MEQTTYLVVSTTSDQFNRFMDNIDYRTLENSCFLNLVVGCHNGKCCLPNINPGNIIYLKGVVQHYNFVDFEYGILKPLKDKWNQPKYIGVSDFDRKRKC